MKSNEKTLNECRRKQKDLVRKLFNVCNGIGDLCASGPLQDPATELRLLSVQRGGRHDQQPGVEDQPANRVLSVYRQCFTLCVQGSKGVVEFDLAEPACGELRQADLPDSL